MNEEGKFTQMLREMKILDLQVLTDMENWCSQLTSLSLMHVYVFSCINNNFMDIGNFDKKRKSRVQRDCQQIF